MTPSSTKKRAFGAISGRSSFAQLGVTAGLLVGLVLLLMSESPHLENTVRILLVQAGSIGLMLLLAICGPFAEDMKTVWRKGINPLILLLLLWTVILTVTAPHRNYAVVEFLRVLDGIVVYIIAAYGMTQRREIATAVAGLLILGVGFCLYDFSVIGQTGGLKGLRINIFGTHENFGSLTLLLMLIPIAFAVSNRVEERWRIAAMVATPILGGGFLLSLTRSAWIGGAAALLALAALLAWEGAQARKEETKPAKSRPKSGPARFLESPAFLLLAGFIVLLTVGGIASTVTARAFTLKDVLEEDLLGARAVKWNGAARMASEKPLTGWGLGSSLVMQGRWTHQGDDTSEVLAKGTSHQNIVHNFYLQWAADTGAVGLALYCAVSAGFLIMACRAVPQLRAFPEEQMMLAGCMAVVVGASVDAIGSPSYNFHGVSSVLWFFIGIGVALIRTPSQQPAVLPPVGLAASLLAGLLIGGGVIGGGYWLRQQGEGQPRGRFEVRLEPAPEVTVGTEVRWIAVYREPGGKVVSTMPGTVWTVQASSDALKEASGGLTKSAPSPAVTQSVLFLRMPDTASPITVTGEFWDGYSRRYSASATVAPKK